MEDDLRPHLLKLNKTFFELPMLTKGQHVGYALVLRKWGCVVDDGHGANSTPTGMPYSRDWLAAVDLSDPGLARGVLADADRLLHWPVECSCGSIWPLESVLIMFYGECGACRKCLITLAEIKGLDVLRDLGDYRAWIHHVVSVFPWKE